MKTSVFRIFAAGFLLSGTVPVRAQSLEPSHLMRIYREDMKSGKGAAHEKVESAYAHMFAKSGYTPYLAMVSMTGTSQAWFLERYDTWEAMGNADRITDAEPLKTSLRQLDAQDGELRSGDRAMILTYQKDMSYLPVPALGAKARFFQVMTVRIRPGHAAEFAEMRKLQNAAWTKAGNRLRRVVYSVTSGAPTGTYLVLTGTDSLKSLDPPPNAMSAADALGSAQERYYKLVQDIVVSQEGALFAVNPKMSNPSKEYLTSDPEFWAPKAMPAAAKPAAKP